MINLLVIQLFVSSVALMLSYITVMVLLNHVVSKKAAQTLVYLSTLSIVLASLNMLTNAPTHSTLSTLGFLALLFGLLNALALSIVHVTKVRQAPEYPANLVKTAQLMAVVVCAAVTTHFGLLFAAIGWGG